MQGAGCAGSWGYLVPAIVAAVVAMLLGVPTLVLAWRQKEIAAQNKAVAQAKLKLDLFDRRMVIFQATWGLLSSVVQEGVPRVSTLIDTFQNHLPAALFLFGPEVEEYMRLIISKRSELWLLTTTQERQGLTPEQVKEMMGLQRWFSDQASTGVREKFAPYLDFGVWK